MATPATALVRRIADTFRLPVLLPHSGCARVLAVWLAVRTVLWVLVIVASHPNPPLDLVEWLSWGHTFQWGYPKHPPLPAWLAGGFARLSPGDVWGVYVLGYLAAGGCFVAAWSLAREYLPPRPALLAAVCLDGLMYLTNDPAEWSNNVALDLGWAWVVVFAHRAIRTRSTAWWAAVGLAVGLTLLCKYTVGILLVPMAVYLVANRDARRNLRRPGPYVAAVVAAAVFAPHAAWLAGHDFITLGYAAERSANARGWVAHLKNPAVFLLGQAYLVAPVVFALLPALLSREGGADSGRSGLGPAGPTDRPPGPGLGFLHAAVWGPVGVLILLSVTTGCLLRQIWGSPLWVFLGVWALATFRPAPDAAAVARGLRRAALVGVGLMAFVVVKQTVWLEAHPKPDRPHFPGKPLAAEVNRRWAERFDRPFPIVAGEPWAAGNVCCYSPHRPVLYSSGVMGYLVFDPRACPWTSDDDLNARGGVVVWDAAQLGDGVPPLLKARLPRAEGQPPVVLPYQTPAPVPPARIGVAFVPPAGR